MKKFARIAGYAFRYFSYFLGLTMLFAAVKDPKRAKAAFVAGAEIEPTR